MTLFRASFLGAALCLGVAASPAAADYGGTWSTDHGELRLHEFDGYVIGDYANRGIILGKRSGDCLAGVFTNGARYGVFRFNLNANDTRFTGLWGWDNGPVRRNTWAGRKTGGTPTQFRNFSRDGSTTQRIGNTRTVFDGSYRSPFGPLRLRQRDLFLAGDYVGRGFMAGMWDGNSYVGVFVNRISKRVGWFDIGFNTRNGSYRSSEWGWRGGASQGEWKLYDNGGGTPNLEEMIDGVSCADAPQQSAPQTPRPQTYRERETAAINPNTDSCGPASLTRHIPSSFDFIKDLVDGPVRDACLRHDGCYRLQEKTQTWCDNQMGRDVRTICSRFGPLRRKVCEVWGGAYVNAVSSTFGAQAYGGEPAGAITTVRTWYVRANFGDNEFKICVDVYNPSKVVQEYDLTLYTMGGRQVDREPDAYEFNVNPGAMRRNMCVSTQQDLRWSVRDLGREARVVLRADAPNSSEFTRVHSVVVPISRRPNREGSPVQTR